MSKYKVGDKVVMKIISADQDEIKTYSVSGVGNNWRWSLPQNLLERYTEPLSTYTEPIEAKIRRQAAEITRLLAENKRLKKENKTMSVKIDCYELYGDQHEEEYNQAFNQGTEAAWELARKIFDMETNDIEDIFITEDAWNLGTVLNNYTYSEAAAKVAQWEKAKEEIKVGDIYKNIAGSCFVICDVNEEDNNAQVLWSSSLSSRKTLDEIKRYYTKTGRHIDIDSFLKQIGGEQK